MNSLMLFSVHCRVLFRIIFLILFLSPHFIFSEVVPKTYTARTLSSVIKIDGIPDDSAWISANVADHFIQLEPLEGADVTQETTVKLLYDNTAIYVLAQMHDSHADSILHELGNRDESGNLNCDAFRFGLDPYNKRQSGYVFEVSASGIQTESFNDDLSFDAVWESATNISSDGWTAEIKIPYSAIRFPAAENQLWGIQFARLIRRNREYDQWTLTPKNVQNRMMFWGTMDGIKNINPPLRLSMTPYFSIYGERSPVSTNGETTTYENSYSYSGGADIKYGIDERFTLDMTLLPDFSQVQSDNKVKNLSAFETIYNENRPFFKEGTALFSNGNLLYTRRIGRTPTLYYDVADNLAPGETLVENPDKARLINATKISGRTDGGLGIGLLNAVTGNTYAEIRSADGTKRKVLTEPLANYNLFIFDQQLKNNCNVFLVNTNVMRDGAARDANVTTAQGRFENKKHTYNVTGSYSQSRVYEWQGDIDAVQQKKLTVGEKSYISADKISGKSWYGASYEISSENYDKNDLGYNFYNDYSQINTYYGYHKFNPFWKYFRQGNIYFYLNRAGRLSEGNIMTSFSTSTGLFLLFNNNWSIYAELGGNPDGGRDYYEPRNGVSFYRTPKGSYGSVNFTTNYNRDLAFDFGGRFFNASSISNTNLGYYVVPRWRVSDHFTITFNNFFDVYNNDVGYTNTSEISDSVFFGQRDIKTIENTLTSRYIFKNDMSLSLSARHYWSTGNYESYYYLQNDGRLIPAVSNDIHQFDFNSSYFTLDLVYNWQFAPGSSFIITYKNLIDSETNNSDDSYLNNLKKTFSDPQMNSISLKVLYYLDYQYFVKK